MSIEYSKEDFPAGSTAHWVPRGIDVTVVVSELLDGSLFVTIEGFDPEAPGRNMRIKPIVNGDIKLRPSTELAEDTNQVRSEYYDRWKLLGLSDSVFDRLPATKIIDIIERKESEVARSTGKNTKNAGRKPIPLAHAKLSKFFDEGHYVPAADFIALYTDPENDQAGFSVKGIFEILSALVHATMYIDRARKVRAGKINTNTITAIRVMFKRLDDLRPRLLETGIIEE
jgi:hypothetical protein